MKVPRDIVYGVIDGEREYQNTKWDSQHDADHSIVDWLTFIEFRLNMAKKPLFINSIQKKHLMK